MTLGEKLVSLRKSKGYSQDDLAEKLEVSRQSISKWETDVSIPELNKIVAISEIYEVSLDHLIKDKEHDVKIVEREIVKEIHDKIPARKILGCVLIGVGLLILIIISLMSEFLVGLILGGFFILLGIILLVVKKYSYLISCWYIFAVISIYIKFATGVTWQWMFVSVFYANGLTVQLIVAWCLFACLLALIVPTAIIIVKKVQKYLTKRKSK